MFENVSGALGERLHSVIGDVVAAQTVYTALATVIIGVVCLFCHSERLQALRYTSRLHTDNTAG